MARRTNNNPEFKDLREQFISTFAVDWRQSEIDIFFEIEAVLRLHELLVVEAQTRDVKNAWVLLSGYSLAGVNDTKAQQEACVRLRSRIRYVKTSTAWRSWLRWYAARAETYRLYRIVTREDQSPYFESIDYGVRLRQERLATYDRLIEQPFDGKQAVAALKWAEAGRYTIDVDGMPHQIDVSEQMAQLATNPLPQRDVHPRTSLASIEIDLDELHAAAYELDKMEQAQEFDAQSIGNWTDRISQLRLVIQPSGQQVVEQRKFTLEAIFHLVGMLGVGKSSLIYVLTYYLATKRNKHVTVVLATVVETFRMAAWLRKMGVIATPALGRNRIEHAKKYGLANAKSLDATKVFNPSQDQDPVLRWMPAICTLSGTITGGIQPGHEPCWNLLDADGNRKVCPIMPICPVHTMSHDLVESAVWIANPISLLQSAAPMGIGNQRMRLLEAVYHVSDVLIIDEADRVQVQWDRALAPTYPLVGSDNSFLDLLHQQLGQASTGHMGRWKASSVTFDRLTRTESQTHILTGRIFHLIRKTPELAKWIKGLQITNESIFYLLRTDIEKSLPKTLTDEDKQTIITDLQKAFSDYWRNPLHRESGMLADWLSLLLGNDVSEKKLITQLAEWLAKQMRRRSTRSIEIRRLTRKLELCVILTALIKRSTDITHQLNWIEDETGSLALEQYEVHEQIVNLIPDPALGILLGLRHVGYEQSSGNLGYFHFVRYLGVGRWLLLNFPRLLKEQSGAVGPHVLLTSATSWMPQAAQFDVAVVPHAVLLAERPISDIEVLFRPIRREGEYVRVSGAGEHQQANLQLIIRELIKNNALEEELSHWQQQGQRRALLLVVNSYEQTDWALQTFNAYPQWQGRVMRLLPDDAELADASMIRAREVEQFEQHGADILIAPLMAIQRGFNILDDEDAALLGTVYFLVRPYPHPDDLSPQILGMNAWTLRQLENQHRLLKPALYPDQELASMLRFRRKAYQHWQKRISAARFGMIQMSDTMYTEYIRDTFVALWQTIGRLLRGGREARVAFVDGAFVSKEGQRHVLRDMLAMLNKLVASQSSWERYLAQKLYISAHQAFQKAYDNKEFQ